MLVGHSKLSSSARCSQQHFRLLNQLRCSIDTPVSMELTDSAQPFLQRVVRILTPSSDSCLATLAGPKANFADPVSMPRWDVLCIAVCLSLTTIVFFLRFWFRFMITE